MRETLSLMNLGTLSSLSWIISPSEINLQSDSLLCLVSLIHKSETHAGGLAALIFFY